MAKKRKIVAVKVVVLVVLCFDEPGQGAHSETLMSLVRGRLQVFKWYFNEPDLGAHTDTFTGT